MVEYRKRIIDNILKRKLEGKGAVLIEGPRWCGKTTTAEQVATSVLYMDDPEVKEQNILMADIEPRQLLRGETPRLIDEWQLAPKLWDAIRFEADRRGELGQFILTGSAVPSRTKDITHSGTGRFVRLAMRTMSLYESGDSTGEISLEALFDGNVDISGESNIDINRLAFLICRGGWAQIINMPEKAALEQVSDYFSTVISSAVDYTDNVPRNPEDVKRVLQSYAKNQGRQISNDTIARNITNDCNIPMNGETVAACLDVLRNIFVIEEVPAWNPYLCQKTVTLSADTRYFVDPSLVTTALDVAPDNLISNPILFESTFRTLCIRDLRVYADSIGGGVYHYRDKDGRECDAVIHLRNGKYGLIEIKLGGEKLIEDGVDSLMALQNKIDYTKMRKPSFVMVLTGVGKYAYRRKDGICIVPIGCLKN